MYRSGQKFSNAVHFFDLLYFTYPVSDLITKRCEYSQKISLEVEYKLFVEYNIAENFCVNLQEILLNRVRCYGN